MFGLEKIKIDKELYRKVKECAQALGYSSADEFAAHVLEKEVDRLRQEKEAEHDQEIERRLRGLGYIS